MCILGAAELLDNLQLSTHATLATLKSSASENAAATAADLERLLRSFSPLVTRPTPDIRSAVSAATLVREPIASYPALLERAVGPPIRIGVDRWLGYVASECALTALRQQNLQSCLAMLFLSTLCSTELEDPAIEALHHLDSLRNSEGEFGLLTLGSRRNALPFEEIVQAEIRLNLQYATSMVQVLGTWSGFDGDREGEVEIPTTASA